MSRETRSPSWRELRQPALLVWALYLFLVPFYIFKSGLPQPGDIMIIVLVPVAFRHWNGKLPRASRVALRPLLYFTLWVCIVDYAWALLLGNFALFGPDTFVMFPLYYIYNALLFVVALVLYQRFGDALLRITLYALYATIVVQVGSSFINQSTIRGSLFFNNPNQLGYYALLGACMAVMLHWRLRQSLISSALALLGCGYLSLVSESRAAMAGIAILFALLVFSSPRMVILASLLAVGLFFVGGPVASVIDSSQDRARNRSANSEVSFLQERGYDRILAHKEYLVLGAGEGGLSRFSEIQMEIHSSFGTVLFSYGAVGMVCFLLFMRRIVQGAPLRLVLVLVPPLLYAVAHQGLRFTTFWVLLAVFVTVKQETDVSFRRRRTRISFAR